MHQLAAPAFAEIEIKKSRFLGQLYPLNSRAEAIQKLNEIRARHPDAVHVCWALICTGDSGLDDDGEPSGTAAKPMYNVLVHKGVSNVLAVVVRYWGGTKLGAGGLTRAYGQAISDAFKQATLVEIEYFVAWTVTCAYSEESQVRHLCNKFQVTVKEVSYTDSCSMEVSIKENLSNSFESELVSLLKGQVRIGKPEAVQYR
ncbi:YigZ family protein [Undibacterium sp. TS12]|uniref:IMPACT family protein n=1 Tax=Undibacterium sp. TS12 TaxID=2908202 RepID=UPI001F4CD395|nr:YigZ family protein [Undibacterium sp. TS12]MCH8618000.1 IMPACT family protein [Undibacterium sp. TS12]